MKIHEKYYGIKAMTDEQLYAYLAKLEQQEQDIKKSLESERLLCV